MEDRHPRHLYQSAAGGNGWFPAIMLLLAMLATGCASVNGSRNPDENRLPSETQTNEQLPLQDGVEVEGLKPTVVAYPDYHDPLIRLNRAVFVFNDVAYRYLLIPVSRQYIRIVPAPVRRSVGNFFFNLGTPVYMVNYMLQLQAEPMLRSMQRFGINSTIGLLGLFDPARDRFDLERVETHFEQTLIQYGAGYGAYLVLPLFGPSDIRNGSSLVVDRLLNPIPYLADSPTSELLQGFDYFQEYAPEAEQYEVIHAEAEEPYIFFRNLYLQGIQRDVEY